MNRNKPKVIAYCSKWGHRDSCHDYAKHIGLKIDTFCETALDVHKIISDNHKHLETIIIHDIGGITDFPASDATARMTAHLSLEVGRYRENRYDEVWNGKKEKNH